VKEAEVSLAALPAATIEITNINQIFPKGKMSLGDLFRPVVSDGFQALRDVSLTIRPGETVGFLGSNGAGKSTLLQVIVGTLKPTSGSVKVRGTISALLELGAGFNPEWTGRRNSEFYCMIQGIAETDVPRHMREIEEFADVGTFFDQPMRTYSSGMFLRVAFAAAVAIDPDIVIVDEALAVGDARFQNKCFNRFKQMQKAGKTILLVTHDPVMVEQFCTRAVVLQAGAVVLDGAPDEAVSAYRRILYGGQNSVPREPPAPSRVAKPVRPPSGTSESHDIDLVNVRAAFSWPPDRSAITQRAHFNSLGTSAGSKPGQIVDVQFLDSQLRPVGRVVQSGSRLTVAIQFELTCDIEKPVIGITVKSKSNVLLYGVQNIMLSNHTEPLKTGDCFVASFDLNVNLARGDYFIDVGLAEGNTAELDVLEWRMSVCHFTVENSGEMFGVVDMDGRFHFASGTPDLEDGAGAAP
jgi:lipopolysaccharide transport system ATP-binding protein